MYNFWVIFKLKIANIGRITTSSEILETKKKTNQYFIILKKINLIALKFVIKIAQTDWKCLKWLANFYQSKNYQTLSDTFSKKLQKLDTIQGLLLTVPNNLILKKKIKLIYVHVFMLLYLRTFNKVTTRIKTICFYMLK